MRAPVLLTAALAASAVPAYSATWYIKPDGTGDAPTIQAGIDSATSGDTVLVAAGTFAEALTMRDGVSLVGETGATATVITVPGPTTNLITCTDVSGSTISAVALDGAGVAERGVLANDCDPAFQDCIVRHFWGMGLSLQGHSTVRHCTIYSCDRAGIYANEPTAFVTVEDCLIYGCGFQPYIASEGIGGHYGGGFTARRCTIVANYHGIVQGDVTGYAEGCIITTNVYLGAHAGWGGALQITCSDVWGNGTDYSGTSPGAGCFTLDPLFCDPAATLYTLDASSPCAPANSGGCGLIGALPVACGPVSIQAESWGRIKGRYR